MRNLRAAIMPLLVLMGIVLLAYFDFSLSQIAHFSFIWDVLLGIVLGACLALLPAMSGLFGKPNALSSMLWVGAFAAMVLVFFQYASLLTGIRLDGFALIANPGPRMRIAEGTMLGFLSFAAGKK